MPTRDAEQARFRLPEPDPALGDDVIRLRRWRSDDADAIVSACCDPELALWLDGIPQPYGRDDALSYVAMCERGWDAGSQATFAITDAASGEVLGSISVAAKDVEEAVAEIGYWVKSEARGRGIASRALGLVSRWALGAGVERLLLRADVDNVASQRVAERAGFVREGLERSARYNARRGRRVDFAVFSLLPGDLPPG